MQHWKCCVPHKGTGGSNPPLSASVQNPKELDTVVMGLTSDRIERNAVEGVPLGFLRDFPDESVVDPKL